MSAQGLVNKVMEILMKKRMRQIENFIKYPIETQENTLFNNLSKARNTEYGNLYKFNEIDNLREFQSRVPLVTYEEFEPYIEDRKSTRLNSSHVAISYAVFCLKKK